MLASPWPLPNGPSSRVMPRLRAPVPQSRMMRPPLLGRHRHAGRVAAVAHRRRPRRGDRSAHAPEAELHQRCPSSTSSPSYAATTSSCPRRLVRGRARVGEDRVDLGVGAFGRVVEQRQARRARLAADLDRVARARVAVVRDALVVLGREHRVVDDQVRSLAQPYHALAHARELLPVLRGQLGARRRRPRDELVLEQDVGERRGVGDVDDRGAVHGQAVRRRDVRVVEPRARDLDVGDRELGRVGQLVELDGGVGLRERDGEVRIVRLRREHRLQVQVVALARVDGHLVAALVERREVRQPLDVVPVRVADQQVDARVPGLAFAGQLLAELADPGAGVDDDARPRRRADLDARGVAAVTFGLGSRHGKRPANAPEADPHDRRMTRRRATTTTHARRHGRRGYHFWPVERRSRAPIWPSTWPSGGLSGPR